ncbi:MAG: MFS transporter [Paracoccaceae bacterium]
MNVDQPTLGKKGTLFLLIALGAFPPLTMDLYLPALPQMTETFSTSRGMINLTLGAYMIAFAIGMLFWGPLSERTGRKPILFAALALYIAASLLCAASFSVDAFNAACAMIGPALYLRLSRMIPVQSVILGCFGALVLGGLAMLSIGDLSPFIFAAIAATTTVAVIIVRVPGANLLLDQQLRDTGSTAALIQFSVTLMGAAGIQIVTFNSHDLIQNYCILLVVIGATCAILWLFVRHRSFVAGKVTHLTSPHHT